MPYTIHLTDGTVLTQLPDAVIDRSILPVALVGRGAVNYGTDFAQNFVHLLETFASVHAPTSPLVGMLWFDRSTTAGRLRYWDGTVWQPVVPDYTPLNVPNTLVYRDANGNFAGGTFTGNTTGTATHASQADHADRATNADHATQADNATNAAYATNAGAAQSAVNAQQAAHATIADDSTRAVRAQSAQYADQAAQAANALKLTYARTINLTGDVGGSAAFDGTSDITINATVGGLSNIQPQIQNIVTNTLNVGRYPFNFVRVTNNIRSTIFTANPGFVTCMGPIRYNKLRSDTNLLILAEITSFNPTYGGAGAVAVRIIDEQTGYADQKGLASIFLGPGGAVAITDTAVFAIIGGAAGVHNYYLQCSRGDNIYYTTIFNPDNADFNGGAHTTTGSTSSFLFMEIIP